MQFSTLLPVCLLVTVGLAQTTTHNAANLPSSTACAAKEVFDTCLATGQGYASSCATTDYSCLCQKWGDILTCYLQCPNDPGYATALATKTTYCNDAVVYASTTTSIPISRAVSSAVSSGTEAANAPVTAASGGGAVRSTSSSAPASTSASGAERLVVGAGVGLMGLVAAVL